MVDDYGLPFTPPAQPQFSPNFPVYDANPKSHEKFPNFGGGSYHSGYPNGSTHSGRGNLGDFSGHTKPQNSKHSRGAGNGGDPSNHSRASHKNRYSNTYKTRPALGIKYQWDGSRAKFKEYERLLAGYLIQVGAGYLVNPNFLTRYEEEGTEHIYSDEFWDKYGIPYRQAKYDRQYLYGILVVSNRNRDNQVLLKNQRSQDGITAWITFKKLYANGGSKVLKLEKLEDEISRPFSSKYSGGMEQYIDSYQATMEKIDALDPFAFSDERKKRMLLKNVRHVIQVSHLVQKCRDDLTMGFEETANYLRTNSLFIDTLGQMGKQSRQSTMLKVDSSTHTRDSENKDLDYRSAMKLVTNMVEETSYSNVYNALSAPSLRQSLRIPDPIWRKMEPKLKEKMEALKQEVIAEKKEQNNSEHGSKHAYKPSPKPGYNNPRDALPAQYPNKVNMVAQEESEDEDSTCDTVLHGFMVLQSTDDTEDIEVRAHLEYAVACKEGNKIYAISDGGADSCILGKNAHVLHETNRYATLVGYNPETTRSKRIPIVSAYLKVREPKSGFPIFLKINEAPYYGDNPITLLSEYQIRENGYVIDSVAKKHRKSVTEYGTQRLELSEYINIPFEDRGGIMGFEILPIEKEDFDKHGEPIYDIFEITGAKQWTPKRFREIMHEETIVDAKSETANIPVPEEIEIFHDSISDEEEPDVFHDANPELHNEEVYKITNNDMYYFDPEDENLEELKFAKAYLTLDEEYILGQPEPPSEVDTFLACLNQEELIGLKDPQVENYGYPSLDNSFRAENPAPGQGFDSFAYAVASWHRVMHENVDPRKLQPYLGYRPLDIIKATIKNTTQMAKMVIRYPLRRHYKSRVPFLNVARLDEVVSKALIVSNLT